MTRLQCRKWYVAGLQFVALTFVDPSRVIADTTPAQHFAEMFIRPESMAEVSSSQGNWLWYADQTLMYKDEGGDVYTTHNIMNKSMLALDAVSRQSKNANAGWCSYTA